MSLLSPAPEVQLHAFRIRGPRPQQPAVQSPGAGAAAPFIASEPPRLQSVQPAAKAPSTASSSQSGASEPKLFRGPGYTPSYKKYVQEGRGLVGPSTGAPSAAGQQPLQPRKRPPVSTGGAPAPVRPAGLGGAASPPHDGGAAPGNSKLAITVLNISSPTHQPQQVSGASAGTVALKAAPAVSAAAPHNGAMSCPADALMDKGPSTPAHRLGQPAHTSPTAPRQGELHTQVTPESPEPKNPVTASRSAALRTLEYIPPAVPRVAARSDAALFQLPMLSPSTPSDYSDEDDRQGPSQTNRSSGASCPVGNSSTKLFLRNVDGPQHSPRVTLSASSSMSRSVSGLEASSPALGSGQRWAECLLGGGVRHRRSSPRLRRGSVLMDVEDGVSRRSTSSYNGTPAPAFITPARDRSPGPRARLSSTPTAAAYIEPRTDSSSGPTTVGAHTGQADSGAHVPVVKAPATEQQQQSSVLSRSREEGTGESSRVAMWTPPMNPQLLATSRATTPSIGQYKLLDEDYIANPVNPLSPNYKLQAMQQKLKGSGTRNPADKSFAFLEKQQRDERERLRAELMKRYDIHLN